ncbi:hypothetical protein Pmani_023565 [Petrolisthes manimaculis]|uniref:Uncharacterized protein n=1 Tax=Petrolisthes manimaculis TaxID=1843537 RepID=A0AAE1U353_9EUCA|nr:hypothetical protein Pmani_023565 [Petrolisthes manimaculis]
MSSTGSSWGGLGPCKEGEMEEKKGRNGGEGGGKWKRRKEEWRRNVEREGGHEGDLGRRNVKREGWSQE